MFRFESPSDFPRQVSFSDLTGIIQRITAPSFYQNTVSTVISPQPFYDIVRSRSSRFFPCAILVTVLLGTTFSTSFRRATRNVRHICSSKLSSPRRGRGKNWHWEKSRNRNLFHSVLVNQRVFTKNGRISIYFITYLLTYIIYVEITIIKHWFNYSNIKIVEKSFFYVLCNQLFHCLFKSNETFTFTFATKCSRDIV